MIFFSSSEKIKKYIYTFFYGSIGLNHDTIPALLVSYYWLSNTLFSSIKLIKPHDKLVLLMFICVWLCFCGDQRGQRLGK